VPGEILGCLFCSEITRNPWKKICLTVALVFRSLKSLSSALFVENCLLFSSKHKLSFRQNQTFSSHPFHEKTNCREKLPESLDSFMDSLFFACELHNSTFTSRRNKACAERCGIMSLNGMLQVICKTSVVSRKQG